MTTEEEDEAMIAFQDASNNALQQGLISMSHAMLLAIVKDPKSGIQQLAGYIADHAAAKAAYVKHIMAPNRHH